MAVDSIQQEANVKYKINIYKKDNYYGWFWFVGGLDNGAWNKGYAYSKSRATRKAEKYIKDYENALNGELTYTFETEGKSNGM